VKRASSRAGLTSEVIDTSRTDGEVPIRRISEDPTILR